MILPVPIADFRANLKKYADMLRGGNLEILVTNHGKAILRCLTPDDVIPEVENPPGVNVELMERLLSGEGEDQFVSAPASFTDAQGRPIDSAALASDDVLTIRIARDHVGTPGDPRYHTGVSGAAGSTMGRGGAGGAFTAKTPMTTGAVPAGFATDPNIGFFREPSFEFSVGIDPSSGPDFTATTLLHRDDAGKVTVVDSIDPFGLLDFLGDE